MINNKPLFIFCSIVLFMLSFTNAGIFLNDEWITCSQLNQLSNGHQLTYNDGKYGYFANNTPSTYMNDRNNVLMYSLALPIVSLPMYILLGIFGDFCRICIMVMWLWCLAYILRSTIDIFKTPVMTLVITILGLEMIVAFGNSFLFFGDYIPSEVLAIVLTNIVILGLCGVVIYRISEVLFKTNIQYIVIISVLSFTSLLFWASTCKDHVLTSFIFLLFIYMIIIINSHKNIDEKYIDYFYVILGSLVGAMIFVRVEIGVALCLYGVCFTLWYNRKYIIQYLKFAGIFSLPMFLNNYIVSGNVLVHPFYFANRGGNTYLNASSDYLHAVTSPVLPSINDIVLFLFAPPTGCFSFVASISILVIALCVINKRNIQNPHILPIIGAGIFSSLYYIFMSGMALSTDHGILPNMRYLIPLFIACILVGFIIIDTIKIKYHFMNRLLFILPIIISIMFIIIFITPFGNSYYNFTTFVNIVFITPIVLLILKIGVINRIRPVKEEDIKIFILDLITLSIALVVTWQFTLLFLYNEVKINAYPMFIPLFEHIHNIFFLI